MQKTVITVDDSMSIRETIRLTLEASGFRVLVAEDGAKGLALAQQEKVDLVITDMNMPVMDGITLITHLRALPQYRFTPILMLTTESQDEKKAAGRKAGATGWIVKPFDPSRLVAVIQKVCPST